MDSKARTLAKAFLWQVLGLVVSLGLAAWLAGSIALGGTIAVANMGAGLALYVFYERLWERISWGRRSLNG